MVARTNAALPDSPPDTLVHRRRAIVDRAALQDELAAVAARRLSAERAREEILAVLGAALTKGQAEVRRRLEAGVSGTETARANCFLVDQIVRAVYDHVTQHLYPLANPSKGERLALVAVGGYGRGEMAPHSDVDLLFLLPYKLTPHSEQVIEAVLYPLWDLGFKVGQATRSIDECLRLAKDDFTIRTALLEARFLWGDQALFVDLKQRFQKSLQARTGINFISSPTSRTARAGCATSRRCIGSPSTSTRSTTSPCWSSAASSPAGRSSASIKHITSCGPCAAICTTWPSVPRSA